MQTLKIKAITVAFIVMLTIMGVSIITSNVFNLNQVNRLEKDWSVFDRLSNERLNIYASIVNDLGYVHVIHNFKNYIIRHSENYYLNLVSDIGGLKSRIRDLKRAGVSASEQEALDVIEQTFKQYEINLNIAKDMIGKGMSIEQIDAQVSIDDQSIIQALDHLKNQLEGKKIAPYPKSFHLTRMARWWGYGGLINNFKNYLLRGDEAYLKAALEAIGNIKKIIVEYRHYSLNTIETDALNIIELTLVSYIEKLATIKMMKQQKKSISEIDKAVRVSGYPSDRALALLYQQFLLQANQKRGAFYGSLESVYHSSVVMLIIGVVSWLLFVFLGFWLFRKNIYTPLVKMTQAMNSIANQQLDTAIPYINNHNEIGQMANALAVFQKNSHTLLSQKQDLADSTIKLEQYNERLEEAYERLQTMYNELENELAINQERRQSLAIQLSENLIKESDALQNSEKLSHQIVELNKQNLRLNDYLMKQLENINKVRDDVLLDK